MKKHFKSIVKAALISVYIIFIAGSVVRMTGAGMGCPDWPKCFGYLIPPTEEEQLQWHPETGYAKGVIIIKEEALLVSKQDFTSSRYFESTQWEAYTKHEYAIFNVYHTWTEYVNRLSSVVAGFIFLFLLAGALKFWKENKKITILCFAAFFLMLFEAWLGKTVVDSVLKPSIITIHMIAGLLIIALLIKVLHIISEKKTAKKSYSRFFQILLGLSILLSVIQIALGTQIRQFVDEQVKIFGFENKQMSLYNPSMKFYIHRSFSVVIVLLNFLIYYKNETLKLKFKLPKIIILLLVFEIISGMLMYYSNFPFGTQTVHLLSGALLFGTQFYLYLQNSTLKF
ncbi:COX15/CtaA family protein [Flavicella sp.]|uniref:COX15/CtaA family protein n=1 Tax=Flavicella sp. TaxID=2957742 RepID=UPI003016F392